jgi:hypothetical protein
MDKNTALRLIPFRLSKSCGYRRRQFNSRTVVARCVDVILRRRGRHQNNGIEPENVRSVSDRLSMVSTADGDNSIRELLVRKT